MRTVLVVDDDGAIRQAIRMVLDEHGYPIKEVENGEEALQVLRSSEEAHVVLLDLMMPRLGGREVLAAMVDEPALARHATILMTAAGRTLPLAVAQDVGRLGVGILSKPFDIDVLAAMVQAATQRLDACDVL